MSHDSVDQRVALEDVARAWDILERRTGNVAVIDYDLDPRSTPLTVASREEVQSRMEAIAASSDVPAVRRRATAHLAYLRQLAAPKRNNLSAYLEETQGWGTPLSRSQFVYRHHLAREAARDAGLDWGPQLLEDIEELEGGPLDPEDVPDRIRDYARETLTALEAIVGPSASMHLEIEFVSVDAYWSYWADGEADHVRIRINRRNARFTEVLIRQFALHEVLGHGVQLTNWHARAAEGRGCWPRYTSVHCEQQIVLEGLAQTLPLFVVPDDKQLGLRVCMDYFKQLTLGQAHFLANDVSPAAAREFLLESLPWMSEADAARAVLDRTADSQLRSYLWAYPVGFDLFVRLKEGSPSGTQERVLARAYQQPLTPAEIAQFIDQPEQ